MKIATFHRFSKRGIIVSSTINAFFEDETNTIHNSSARQGVFEDEQGSTKTKKPALRLACLVDYTGIISNLMEDLLRLDRFAESVEDELSTSPR